MIEEKKKLNKEQIKAIKFGEGPLLIIAGAGTGKTTVVTERIKFLITSGKAKTTEILALTFTDKAAREMEERVDLAMPYGYTDMWISTFHAFGDRVLRQEGIHIGLASDYKLMTEAETIHFLIKNLFKFDLDYFRPLGNPTKFVGAMLQHFSRLKDEDISPDEYLKFAQKEAKDKKAEKTEAQKTMELAKAFQSYEQLKDKQGLLDYADLIGKTLKLFRTRKNILKQYQGKFKYILVDEFQDTNYAQNQLALILTNKKQNINVCADDDQCLPAKAKILTPRGKISIKDIKIGDPVITAVGKSHLSYSKVIHKHINKKKAKMISFTTESGKKIEVTDNHKMFCMLPGRKFSQNNYYYVYLMERIGFGWRLGITNDPPQRLKLERSADRIFVIKCCTSLEEASLTETIFSLKYQIPTYPFKPRKQMRLNHHWLKKLFTSFDTKENALKLACDLGIDLNSHHYCLGAVVRGNKTRIKINLKICSRKYGVKKSKRKYLTFPKINHEVSLETSSLKMIKILDDFGISLNKAKKGRKVLKYFVDLKEAGEFADKLVSLTGGILEVKFDVAKRNKYSRPALVMPASNVFTGMYLPVVKNDKIVYEEVVKREEKVKLLTVYDLEIEKTHNFIANDVVVHNSIYRWRGAAISNVIQFKQTFPKAKIVVLTQNYRSTQIILDHAYQLIQNNNPDRLEVKEKIDKHLSSTVNTKQYPLEFLYTERVEDEAESVAQKIKQLTEKDYQYGEIAILVRANNHADSFTRALARHNIPYQFLGPGQLFRQPEVKDLIAYLKLLYNFEDSVALYRVLSMPDFEVNARDLAAINNFARRQNLSLFEACEQIQKIFVNEKSKKQIDSFVMMFHRHLGLLTKETAGQILYYFLQDTGLLKKMTDFKTLADEKKAQNISRFFDRLRTYEIDHEDASIQAVVDWINLSMQLGESPAANNFDWFEENRVNLLTIHSAKGLEFPIVFLVNLVAARFPTTERRETIPIPQSLIKEILPIGDHHLQEERRLFYVGLTRAQERLFLTAANYYGEGKRGKKTSPFVAETLGPKVLENKVNVTDNQLSIFEFQPQPQLDQDNQPSSGQMTPINYLSFSQMETFANCPLQYRYRYLQRIPVPPSGALSFGDSIHRTLKDFYQLLKDGGKPNLKDLLKILTKNWSSLGYGSKEREEKTKERAKQLLTKFYQKFDSKLIPKALEQPFIIKVSPGLKVGGKIDRVDIRPNGKMEIVDYKTGKPMEQKQVDQSLQMTVYALAAADKGIYDQKPKDLILTFYFLDAEQKRSTIRTEKQLEDAKKEIVKRAKEIETSQFEAKPSKLCDWCEYRLICEAWD